MGNSNLKTFDNLYSSLAESAYNGRPNSFSMKELTETQKKLLESGESIPFYFSKNAKSGGQITAGGKNLPHGGKVYLQPDPTLGTIGTDVMYLNEETEKWLGLGPHAKGLMTDEQAGFNSYFLTDSEKLGPDTTKAYMAIRGSDGFNFDKVKEKGVSTLNLNDWYTNDFKFAINAEHIPQAKLATVAMKERISEIREKAPEGVTMDVTAHSLGTMVSVQGLAGLTVDELQSIGDVVLFDGPNTSYSLKKMGVSDEVYQALDEKITYYVNPFDMVSMLNRAGTIYNLKNPGQPPEGKALGTVHIVVPLHYTPSFHPESAHDFGVFQPDGRGGFLTASEDFHPELLVAGEKLAQLDAKFIAFLRAQGYGDDVVMNIFHTVQRLTPQGFLAELTIGSTSTAMAAKNYFDEYQAIVDEARKEAIAYDVKYIEENRELLRNGTLTGMARIEVQTKFLHAVSQLAVFRVEDEVVQIHKILDDIKKEVTSLVNYSIITAKSMAKYLNASEVEQLMADFTFESVWDENDYSTMKARATAFQNEIDLMAVTIMKAATEFENIDQMEANSFVDMMQAIRVGLGMEKINQITERAYDKTRF